MAIDKEANHDIVHLLGLGKANGFSGEAFDSRP
jgi:hypothetical protein